MREWPTETNRIDRLRALDGVRGWAALTVLFYHIWVDGFPVSAESAALLRHFLLFNGNIAVYLFFVISGFALSIGYFRQMDSAVLVRLFAGRYIRLVIPVFSVSIIFYTAMCIGLVPEPSLRPPPFAAVLQEVPTLWSFIGFHSLQVFVDFDIKRTVVFALWTMQYEFLGSIVLLGLLWLTHRMNKKILILVAVGSCLFIIHRLYGLMFIGAVLAALFNRWPLSFRMSGLLLTCVCLLVVIGGTVLDHGELPLMLTAVVIFLSAITVPSCRVFFSSPLSAWLGKISFPLYLVHGVILWLVGLRYYGHVDQVLLNCLMIVVSLASAATFVPIEILATSWARKFGLIFTAAVRIKNHLH